MSDDVRIRCRARGPLVVEGNLEAVSLTGLDGNPIEVRGRKRLLLCRCGASGSRPLCDGSHNRTGFEAPEDDPNGRETEPP